MRILRAHGPKRDFSLTLKTEREFSLHGPHRDFKAVGPRRKFGYLNPDNATGNTTTAWLWGDTDKILSQIGGTFGDQL